jgi:hypothetical protein
MGKGSRVKGTPPVVLSSLKIRMLYFHYDQQAAKALYVALSFCSIYCLVTLAFDVELHREL